MILIAEPIGSANPSAESSRHRQSICSDPQPEEGTLATEHGAQLVRRRPGLGDRFNSTFFQYRVCKPRACLKPRMLDHSLGRLGLSIPYKSCGSRQLLLGRLHVDP